MKTVRLFMPDVVSLASAYAEQVAEPADIELVIPESFDGMEYAAVVELRDQAIEAFDAQSADGASTETLSALIEGIEALAAEITTRDEALAAEAEAKAALAAKVDALRAKTDDDSQAPADEDDSEDDGDADDAGDDEDSDESAAHTETLAAKPTRKEVRVSLGKQSKAALASKAKAKPSVRDVVKIAGESLGYSVGSGVDFGELALAVDQNMRGYNGGAYGAAHKANRHISETHNIATIHKPFAADLMIENDARDHVDRVMALAVDEKRLPQGSLVASGGWCAPSEVVYDLLEIETREGMISLPEVGIRRGGLMFTRGPSFADLYSTFPGFAFTEEEAIEGKYEPGANGNVVGPKPCVSIECPEFEEVRLDVAGLCIQAGLLQSRGYPEVIARTLRGALVAHDHHMNARKIAKLAADSTAVEMGETIGAAAPLLNAIELQVAHYRSTHRLRFNQTLEAVFPFWVRGAIRADLALREGLDVMAVSDAQILGWFSQRGVSAQFVYDWQNINSTAAGDFTAWPEEITFLLYLAGTFVLGSQDVITLGTMYDSTLLANNDYSALFTEEGWLIAKRGFDSRAVTVPLCPSGAVAAAVATECGGAPVDAGLGG